MKQNARTVASRVRVLSIVGSGRSGSTLLEMLLGQLPGFASVGELTFIWERGLLKNQLCGCGAPFRECQFWTEVGEVGFGGWSNVDPQWAIGVSRAAKRGRHAPLLLAPKLVPRFRRNYDRCRDLWSRLYDAIHAVSDGGMIVDSSKHPGHALFVASLPGVDLRLLHLVRDCRGVAYSWRKKMLRPEGDATRLYMPVRHPADSALRWTSENLFCHALAAKHRSALMRYEALIREPVAEMNHVLDRLGIRRQPLPFISDGEVEIEPTHTVAGNPARFRTGTIPLRVDEEWRRAMRRSDRALVTALAFPLLLRYGYLRGRAAPA